MVELPNEDGVGSESGAGNDSEGGSDTGRTEAAQLFSDPQQENGPVAESDKKIVPHDLEKK